MPGLLFSEIVASGRNASSPLDANRDANPTRAGVTSWTDAPCKASEDGDSRGSGPGGELGPGRLVSSRMRLHSIRVRNCFGFRDSGDVDLGDPGNLIYVLGRNSSGKTALLTAIEAFSSAMAPSDYPDLTTSTPLTRLRR